MSPYRCNVVSWFCPITVVPVIDPELAGGIIYLGMDGWNAA